MANDKHEVELILKASNLSSKTLKEVTAAVNNLRTSLDEQVTAAKKGQVTIGELNTTYRKLEEAGRALIGQQALVGQFRKVSEAVEFAADKVNKAKAAFNSLASEQANYSQVTKQQDRDLTRLAKSVVSAEKELSRQQKTLSGIADDAERAGLDLADLVTVEERLVQSARDVASAQQKASAEIDGYAANIRRLKSEEKSLAEAEKALADADKARIAEMEHVQNVLRKTAAEQEAATKAFQAAHAQNVKFAQDAAYVRLWTEALDKAEAEEREFIESVRAASAALEAQAKAAKAAADVAEKAAEKKRNAEEKAAEAARKAAEKAKAKADLNPFGDSGRTTLSLLQRIRGEVLAVTAAYVGLQGAIEGVRSVIQTVKTEQQVQSKLLAANGNDAKAAGDDFRYLRAQAERLGAFLPDLTKNYSSFAIAARAANMDTKQMRFVFERVAEAGKVMQLDADDMNGIFKAIEQMVSKGQIQSEELKGQLGDRLPGALVFAAKKYEGGVKEFVKQLEKGNVEATKGVINLARGLDENFNKQLAGATTSIQSQENRFKNAIFDFQQVIAKSGLAEAYEKLIIRLTEFLRSDEGADFAKKLAEGFTALADALIFVVDNLDTFVAIAETLIGLYLAKQLFNMAFGAAALVKEVKELNTNLGKSTTEVANLQRAFILLQTFMASWQLGTIAYDQFEEVRVAAANLVFGLDSTWIALKYGGQIAWAKFSDAFIEPFKEGIIEILKLSASAAKAMGADELAKSIETSISSISLTSSVAAQSRVKQLKDQMKTELQQAAQISKELAAEATDAYRKAEEERRKAREKAERDRMSGVVTGDPGGSPATFETGDEEAKKLIDKYKSLLAEVEAVEAQSMKKQKDSIESIIGGIDLQYQALIRKINESGVKGAEELRKRLEAAVGVLKTEAIDKYNQAQLQQVEAIQKSFAAIETKLGKADSGTMEQRLQALDATYKTLYADIAALDADRQGDLKETLDLLMAQLRVVEQQKFAQDKIGDSQKQLNDLVSARDDRIKTTNDLIQSGIITEQEGHERIRTIITDSQPGIEQYAATTREIVESLKEVLDPAAYDAAIAKIDLATASAGKYKTELYSAADANRDLASGVTGALKETTKGFADAISGAQTFGDALRGAGQAFLQFAADFLMKIAEMILQQIIFNALQNSGYGGAISGGVNGAVAVAHEGGTVGSLGRSRSVSPGWFDNAPRYHTGGISGMAPDEYPAILKKNEEILTTDDPRNILNGGLSGGQSPAIVPQDIKVINAIDSGSMVSEGLSTPSGTKAIFNVIRANKAQVKAILGA
jgi:tape measure domain-containing protein